MAAGQVGSGVDVVVMAAGQGTRMKSATPKVLHRLAGRSMLAHVLAMVAQLRAHRVVVVTGHGADAVEAAVAPFCAAGGTTRWDCVRQLPQRGTGHAVQQAAPLLGDDGIAVVLNGDVPLVAAAAVRALIDACGGERLALSTVELPDPAGYGRIVRDAAGTVRAVVEHKDATEAQRAIRETYTGMLAAPAALLKGWLARLTDDNAQREFYLTDIVRHAVADGVGVVGVPCTDPAQVAGVNSPAQLAALERIWQRRHAEALMEAGVRLADPDRIDVRGTLDCGRDVEIDVGCVFDGAVRLGDGVRIGAHCVVTDAEIAAGAVLHPFSHVDGGTAGVSVGPGARVGPFARLRPGARLGADVHVGNFVEVKNTTMADGAKANHLAYLGDAAVGARVNYGAGSITANYDGVNKHRTVIGDDVHVGSNCVLVAPVTIGAGGTVGAGSTVTRSTPPGALTVVRGALRSIADWGRPKKKA